MFTVKRLFYTLLFLMVFQSVSGATPDRIDEYQILRNDTPVGTHKVSIKTGDGATLVKCQSNIEIGFLGLTFYDFTYTSEETWDSLGLLKLKVHVDDDGKQIQLSGSRQNNGFVWQTKDGQSSTETMPVFPGNHWNAAVVSQNKILNTLTGDINRVSIKPYNNKKDELIEFYKIPSDITRYRYEGELRLDSWYDNNGRWPGMRFKGDDGANIEYRCVNCARRASL